MGRRKKFRPEQGKDYIFDERHRIVWTRDYLLRLGACCGARCSNCPYGRISGSSEIVPAEGAVVAAAPAACASLPST